MTDAADLLLTNARVYSLAGGDPGDPRTWPGALHPDAPNDEPPEPDGESVAIRDGEILAVGRAFDVELLAGVETTTVDLDGRPVFPGFVDAHTHLVQEGLSIVHADLGKADSLDAALELLDEQARATDDGWVVGVGYDESTWPERRHPRRDELDAVADDRPVAAVRVDLHTATLDATGLDLVPDCAADDVRTDDGEPTGVVVESAAHVVEPVFDPGADATRTAIEAAIDRITARGLTGVHDKVRNSHAPRVYRDLDLASDLDCRVRIDYWADHLDAVRELGLRTGHGSDLVTVGGIKTFTDGSIGGRTAKLTEPYADADPDAASSTTRGTWVVDPEALRSIVADATDADLQLVVHAIGDEAIEETVAALETAIGADGASCATPHRVEHAELATDGHLERMADAGIAASMQPNFHRWAGEGGLYETALGPERTTRTNRLGDVAAAGVALAFGSDGMPTDPLVGIHHAVNAPTERQSISVGAALKAYATGPALVAGETDRLGTVAPHDRADLVALDALPWDDPAAIRDVGVALTVVDGRVVHDGR